MPIIPISESMKIEKWVWVHGLKKCHKQSSTTINEKFTVPSLHFLEMPPSFPNGKNTTRQCEWASGPKPSPNELALYRTRKATELKRWQEARIVGRLKLCFALHNGGGNWALLVAATCFWDNSNNTFNFWFDQMYITLLDVLTITWLPVHSDPYCYGEYDQSANALVHLSSPIWQPYCKSYTAWFTHFSKQDNEQGGIAFLELWLCKFIFCITASKITGSWTMLATALFNRQLTRSAKLS